jgi:hypothetical protein
MQPINKVLKRFNYFIGLFSEVKGNKVLYPDRKLFNMLDHGEKNQVIQKLRLYLNDLAKGVNSAPNINSGLRQDYIDKYNKIVDVVGDKIYTEKMQPKDEKTINDMKARFAENMIDSKDLAMSSLNQKINFYEAFLNVKNPEDVFSPRQVLFQTGTFWTEKDKKAITDKYLETKRGIMKEVRKMFDEDGQTNEETISKVHKLLSEHYPTGKVPIPRRITDKFGNEKVVTTNMNLNSYVQTWVMDIQTMNDSLSVVGAIRNTGRDLIEVAGGVTDNKICDPYSTPGHNIYSLTGKTEGYPILSKYPPYHPHCSKYLTYKPEMKKLEKMGIKTQQQGQI